MNAARPSIGRWLAEPLPSADGLLVRGVGEVDIAALPELRRLLDLVEAGAVDKVVIDLTGVTFIDSMMLGVLLSATRRARPNGTELRIVVDDPHVRRIFELTLLDHVMKLYPSVEIALSSSSAGERVSGD